jgi:hypothetical protein
MEFSASQSSASVSEPGFVPSLYTTRQGDISFVTVYISCRLHFAAGISQVDGIRERRNLPIIAKATFSNWPRSATEFLRDTSYVPQSRVTVAEFFVRSSFAVYRNQPFFFETTRPEFYSIDSSMWR